MHTLLDTPPNPKETPPNASTPSFDHRGWSLRLLITAELTLGSRGRLDGRPAGAEFRERLSERGGPGRDGCGLELDLH